VTFCKKAVGKVGSDKTSPAGDEYSHAIPSL